jgi:hypothetical protein
VAQDYLGVARTYYNPTDRGQEGRMAQAWRELRAAYGGQSADDRKS